MHMHTQRQREYVPISGYIPDIITDVTKAWHEMILQTSCNTEP